MRDCLLQSKGNSNYDLKNVVSDRRGPVAEHGPEGHGSIPSQGTCPGLQA